jgi:alpha-mannosidase
VAHELNALVQAIPLSRAPKKPSRSVFRLSSTRVSIDTVKQAEDGNDVILRMYETMGGRTRVRLETDLPVTGAIETSIEEQPIGEVMPPDKSAFELEFGPFEIKTVRLTLK